MTSTATPAPTGGGPLLDAGAVGAIEPDWPAVQAALDDDGVALTSPLLPPDVCAAVADLFGRDGVFRSTVVMSAHRFGSGTYRYFGRPLPPLIERLRRELYPPLAAIANRWARRLGEPGYPGRHDRLLAACAAAGQHQPTPLLLRYETGGYNRLHQDVYGAVTFPLQVAIMLSRPGHDFTGGESVFVEQQPRAQSRPVVLRPGQGQGVIFPVRHRPVSSARGYSRVTFRHGVSAVRAGSRIVLGIIFHDAT